MSTYKVVLEVETNYSEDDLRSVLEALFAVPEAEYEGCTRFRAEVLALAETQSSRQARQAP